MAMAPPEPDVSTSQELVFLTNWSCPYSQRVAIALNEKEVPHQVVEIDLNEKPDWFFKYSTYGFTPAFMVPYGNSARGVFHNLFCNEYLEDAYPTNALLPADLVKRAEARRLIDAIANKSIASLYRAQLADADDQQELFAAVDDELRWFTCAMLSTRLPCHPLSCLLLLSAAWRHTCKLDL
jgi:glutathione S-transferase